MKIQTIKTEKLTKTDNDILAIIDTYVHDIKEDSIIAITSKIVAICEGAIVPFNSTEKTELVRRESNYYLDKTNNKYDTTLTIKNGIIIPNAGIDESNSADGYILWPRDAQKSANTIRAYLTESRHLKNIGVVITDSKTSPLRRGTTGVALAHSGFLALNDYVGHLDIFNNPLKMTKANIADGLAAAAVLCMGEGNEQTPLALINDINFVEFQDRDPSRAELNELQISLEDDL